MHVIDIRRAVERKIAKQEVKNSRRTTAKPGRTYYFSRGKYFGSVQNVAPFLPSSPIVDGVRMRYEKGKLVPRVRG